LRSELTITLESPSIRASLSDRSPESEAGRYLFDGFIADPFTRSLIDPEGGDIELTGAEFDLLLTLRRNLHVQDGPQWRLPVCHKVTHLEERS
jgi:hypothetical protein